MLADAAPAEVGSPKLALVLGTSAGFEFASAAEGDGPEPAPAEWAATGKVTLPLSDDFPTADKSSSRDY